MEYFHFMEIVVLFFTSDSKSRTHRRSRLILGFGACTLLFLVLVLMGRWVSRNKSDWVYQDPLPEESVDWNQSILGDAFGEPYDEYIFYHDIGHVMTWARQADVLILGNSRSLFAFRSSTIEEAEKQSGLKIYNLSGPGSTVTYALALIRKQNLRPHLIVLNEDNFFNSVVWPSQKAAMAQSDWQSEMSVGEHYLSLRIENALRLWIPRFGFFKEHGGKSFYLLRSAHNGALFLENVSSQTIPLAERSRQGFQLQIDSDYFERAEQFKKEMKERGVLLVLTHVPSSVPNEAFAKTLAVKLQIPYVEPRLLGLETFDQSHLSPASGDRFSKAFFKKLFQLDEVKKMTR
jgi:hypothetical protein